MIPVHDMTNLRLQVEGTPAAMPNRFPDPDGERGTFLWWVVRETSTMTSDGTAYTLTRAGAADTDVQAWAQKIPITGGKWYRPRYTVTGVTAGHTLRTILFYYDATGAQILSGVVTVPTVSGADSYGEILQAPANAVAATFAVVLYKGAVQFPVDLGAFVTFRDVMLAEASSSAALAAPFAFTDPITWANILGPTHSIEINREGLEVGTLDAIVLDAALDPAVSTSLTSGNAVRLQALVSAVWENVFVGKIDDAEAVYTYDKETNEVLTSITLNATDAIATLAASVPTYSVAVSGARGYPTIVAIPQIIESWAPGVAWKINGSDDHVTRATSGHPTSYNPEASMLDQIAATRDTAGGYAWVDRHNVLVAYDKVSLPAAVQCQFTDVKSVIAGEDHYSSLAAGFNKADVINQVTITWLRTPNSGVGGSIPEVSEEITYGPYSDDASMRRYGARSKTFVMQGVTENAATIEAFARAIIAANKTPVRKASELVLPVKDLRSLGHAVKLDLYDLVGVKFKALLNTSYRITSIKHQIDTDGWLTTYGFGINGAVAAPSAPPAPVDVSAIATDGTWINATLAGLWANSGGADAVARYMRKDGIVYLQGTIKTGTLNTTAFTLPTGYRPNANLPFPAIANGAFARLAIGSTGTVIPVSGSNVWFSLAGVSFPADQ